MLYQSLLWSLMNQAPRYTVNLSASRTCGGICRCWYDDHDSESITSIPYEVSVGRIATFSIMMTNNVANEEPGGWAQGGGGNLGAAQADTQAKLCHPPSCPVIFFLALVSTCCYLLKSAARCNMRYSISGKLLLDVPIKLFFDPQDLWVFTVSLMSHIDGIPRVDGCFLLFSRGCE